MDFLQIIGCKLIKGFKVLEAELFVIIMCCRESMSVEDAVHSELSFDPSNMGELRCEIVYQYRICCK